MSLLFVSADVSADVSNESSSNAVQLIRISCSDYDTDSDTESESCNTNSQNVEDITISDFIREACRPETPTDDKQ